MSSSSAITPGAFPNVRATFVAPTLRLPCWRMSFPVIRNGTRKLKGSEPMRYVATISATGKAEVMKPVLYRSAERGAEATPLDPVERVLEVGDEILDVLDADGDAYQSRRDAEAGAGLDGDGGVGHGLGMRDQRLDPAERFAEGAELHAVEELLGVVVRAELERDHGTEAAHLPARQIVLRVIGEAGVVELLHLCVMGEVVRHRLAVFLVPLHPHGERLDAAQHEPRIERREDRADGVLQEADLLRHLVAVRDHDAADRIGVTVEELRR